MIAENFIAKVMTGDVPAVKEFADRIDGKVPQAIVGDSEHDPIGIEQIVRKIVDPKSRDSDSPGIPAAAGTGEV